MEIQISLFRQSIYTYTLYSSVPTCLELVHTLYIPSTYIECTNLCLYVQRTRKQTVAFIEVRTHNLKSIGVLP